ncbi:MAG TPA: helix-turn-helix transcriptional regulator [Verrucomicrobiae bacterium]|jgi:DNA-binding CsgD family transcriptional regulator|nr:helix-turn-helix transcriptional regulator [Verrucomicrobiae bacterium]
MDHLLVVPLKPGVPQTFVDSLQKAGWRVTVTPDLIRAKQLLQKGDVAGLMMEFSPAAPDPDRLKVLRFVHEFCPGTMVIMLHAGASDNAGMFASRLVKTLDTMDDDRANAKAHAAFEFFHLSPAQKRITQLVAQAYPNREIARKLKIKEQSVRNEISRIFKKVGVWNRVELALLMQNGPAQVHAAPGSPEGAAIQRPWTADLKPPIEKLEIPRNVTM